MQDKQNIDVPLSNKSHPSTLRIVIVTAAVWVVELMLFEFVRMPYRPPHDMSSLLGGEEKYIVYGVMCVIAVIWLLYVLGVRRFRR